VRPLSSNAAHCIGAARRRSKHKARGIRNGQDRSDLDRHLRHAQRRAGSRTTRRSECGRKGVATAKLISLHEVSFAETTLLPYSEDRVESAAHSALGNLVQADKTVLKQGSSRTETSSMFYLTSRGTEQSFPALSRASPATGETATRTNSSARGPRQRNRLFPFGHDELVNNPVDAATAHQREMRRCRTLTTCRARPLCARAARRATPNTGDADRRQGHNDRSGIAKNVYVLGSGRQEPAQGNHARQRPDGVRVVQSRPDRTTKVIVAGPSEDLSTGHPGQPNPEFAMSATAPVVTRKETILGLTQVLIDHPDLCERCGRFVIFVDDGAIAIPLLPISEYHRSRSPPYVVQETIGREPQVIARDRVLFRWRSR